TIPITKLLAHPANPNVMSEATFRKLVRNIERTGLYEPIVARPHPKKKNCFEIINGHHRVKALEQLGRKEVDCVVWNIDDEQTAVLLATLNRLSGSDVPAKKIELLKELTKKMGTVELAKILPQTAKQIDRLINLKLADVPIKADAEKFAIPIVFFVNRQQQEIIEKAIDVAYLAPGFTWGLDSGNDKPTKAQLRAAAITKIAKHFIKASETNN
ncbi:MAG: ParB N-terminal domain-containing protein, partial [Sedimentisphaerales bacterium]|nr:ParB N-terminal domain-containing protein [Sedimentisphaerales bacterium]